MASRREFIKMLMVSTGATYAVALGGCNRPSEMKLLRHPRRIFDTPQFRTAHAFIRDGQPLPRAVKTHRVDVVVVGGGFAGLSAAATLEDHGVNVVLVESEYRAGGAAVSQELAGGLAPLGSVYFVDKTPEIEALLKRAQIEPVNCPPDGYDFGTGEIVRNLWTDSTLNRVVSNVGERDGMKRFRDVLLKLGPQLPEYPLPDILTPELAALDVSAEDWVKQFKSQILLTILNAYSRSSEGALLGRTNVYCLQNFYSSELGDELETPRYTFPGGTGAFSSALAKTLKSTHTSHLAARIHHAANKVFVDCVNEKGDVVRYEANHVIMAAQKFQAPYLIQDLPQQQADACSELSYAPYMTLHIVSDLPLIEPGIYDTWNLTSDLETDVVNPCSVPGSNFNKNVASLYLPMDRFARGQLQNEELFARRAADVVNRFLSSRSAEQANSVREIYCWGWGHGMVVPTPGSHSGVAQAARQQFGKILFTGADNDASPALENAVYNGTHTALSIVKE